MAKTSHGAVCFRPTLAQVSTYCCCCCCCRRRVHTNFWPITIWCLKLERSMRLVFDFMSWWISPAQAICCRCCKLWLALRSVLQTWDVCMCTLYARSIHTCVVGAAANVATRFCKIKSVTRLMLPITNKFVNQLSNFRRTASPRRLCKCETSYDFARCDCKAGHQFRACLQAKHSVFLPVHRLDGQLQSKRKNELDCAGSGPISSSFAQQF